MPDNPVYVERFRILGATLTALGSASSPLMLLLSQFLKRELEEKHMKLIGRCPVDLATPAFQRYQAVQNLAYQERDLRRIARCVT